jgi:hypothetical protein
MIGWRDRKCNAVFGNERSKLLVLSFKPPALLCERLDIYVGL